MAYRIALNFEDGATRFTAEASFLVRKLPDGAMSGWLAEKAEPGTRMSFVGPQGSFFLRDAQMRLQLREGHLDRVEVWAIGRQEQESGAFGVQHLGRLSPTRCGKRWVVTPKPRR